MDGNVVQRSESVAALRRRWIGRVALVVAAATVVAACTGGDGGGAGGGGGAGNGDVVGGAGVEIVVSQPTPCEATGCVAATVDTASGALVIDETDLLFPPGLFGIELARSYRSDRTTAGLFGPGWATSYDTSVSAGPGTVTIDAPAGLAPMWAPEAPAGWMVTGNPKVQSEPTATTLTWPTGEQWTFASTGELTHLASPFGHTVTIERNADAVVLTSSQGVTVTMRMVEGRVESAESSDGRVVDFGYDGTHLASAVGDLGELRYVVNGDGRIGERLSGAGTITTRYDGERVVEQTMPDNSHVDIAARSGAVDVTADGATQSYEHDADGRLTRISNGAQTLLEREFDDEGRLVEERTFGGDEVASELVRRYDDGRLVEERVDGIRTSWKFDDLGRATEVKTADETTRFRYDAAGVLPVEVEQPGGGTQMLELDASGWVVESTDPTGVVTTVGRDELGNAVSLATGGRGEWAFEFDAEGNQTVSRSPGGRVTRSEWEPGRLLAARTDPLGRSTTFRYDAAGREVLRTGPDGAATSTEYDALGRVVRSVGPDGAESVFEYGPDGEPSRVTDAAGQFWTYRREHTDGATIETATNPDGSTTRTEKDSAGRTRRVVTLAGDATVVSERTLAYEFGRVVRTEVTERGETAVITADHDAAGRLVTAEETFPGREPRRREWRYEDGRLVGVAAGAESANVEYGYDDAGRIVSVERDGETVQARYEQGLLVEIEGGTRPGRVRYDEDARVVGIDDRSGSASWELDDAGRAIARSIGAATATFEWTPGDLLAAYVDPMASRWTYGYGPAGRLVSAEEPTGAATSYEYEHGRTVRIRGEGAGRDVDDRYEYDETTGRLEKAKVRGAETELEYDALGRVASLDGPGGDEEWVYDATGTVAEVRDGDDVFALTHGPSGDLQSASLDGAEVFDATYEDGALQQVVAEGRDVPITIERDDEGRLASIRWDAERGVDLRWNDDGARLDLVDAGSAEQVTYLLDGARLVGFEAEGERFDAEYGGEQLVSLAVASEADGDARVGFDVVGRPDVLEAGGRSARIGYDADGRVANVDRRDDDGDAERTTVTYGDGERDIDGDDDVVDMLFNDEGFTRAPLPGALPNPTSPIDPFGEALAQLGAPSEGDLSLPEPDPLSAVRSAIRAATPFVPSAIGVGDLDLLARRTAASAVFEEAPVFELGGRQMVRLTLIDPETGELDPMNPFVDASAAGAVLGAARRLDDGSPSLFERSVDFIQAAVGGTIDALGAVGSFLLEHPIGSLLPDILNVAGCFAFPPGCVVLTAAVQAIGALGVVMAAVEFVVAGLASCLRADVATCGVAVASVGIAAVAGAGTARTTRQLMAVRTAGKNLRAATSATQRAAASGRLGVERSKLLAQVRHDRVIAEERPICAGSVCARADLITRDVFGRLRVIEVKNGPGARLTANQRAVYGALQDSGLAYFPHGLVAGGAPVSVERALYVLQRHL